MIFRFDDLLAGVVEPDDTTFESNDPQEWDRFYTAHFKKKIVERIGINPADPKHRRIFPEKGDSLVLLSEHIASHLLMNDGPVVDVGCGCGAYLCYLHSLGFSNLIGVDVSMTMLEIARRHLTSRHGIDDIVLLGAFACAMPFKAGTLSSIYTRNTIEHMWDVQRFITGSYESLRLGGRLVVVGLENESRNTSIGHLNPLRAKSLRDSMSRLFPLVYVEHIKDLDGYTYFIAWGIK
jgi:ubiquinone/menaquinone biosynthesis C-methylase UbiE